MGYEKDDIGSRWYVGANPLHQSADFGGAGHARPGRRVGPSGLCLDNPQDDTSTYLAGSEDGYIYQCYFSYNEQHLDAFKGHDGPVNQIRFSPLSPNTFITCSADWTTKMWSISNNECNLISEFYSTDLFDSVNDVAWSTTSPSVFALVTGDGRLEVWDVTKSKLDPIVKHLPESTVRRDERNAVVFGHQDSVLVTGSRSGCIEVFSTKSILIPK